jgi:hypothetical protein
MGFNLKDLKLKDFTKVGEAIIAKGLPLLGTVLGGPVGGSIGGLVAKAVGADSDEPEEIMKKLETNPDAVVKLKEIETQYKVKLEELSIESSKVQLDMMKVAAEERKAELDDTKNAREREMEYIRKTGKTDKNQYVLAYLIVGGFFVALILFMYYSLNEKTLTTNPIVDMLFGGLVTGFATVLGYYFGSSKGSAEKTMLMREKPKE